MEERSFLQNEADRMAEFEAEMIVKGIEISWTTWGRMRGEKLITGAVSYLKAEGDYGFERIYSVDMKENPELEIQKMIALIKTGILPDSILITPMTRPSNLAEILADSGLEELKSWLDIINEALFEGELVTAEQFGDVLRLDNTSFYLGFAEGRPVSACLKAEDVIWVGMSLTEQSFDVHTGMFYFVHNFALPLKDGRGLQREIYAKKH